jgi:hypothetical protein
LAGRFADTDQAFGEAEDAGVDPEMAELFDAACD